MWCNFKCYYSFRTVSRTSTGTHQNFIIGCRYFLKKSKLPVRTKTLLFVAVIFLVVIFLFSCCYLFVFLSYFSHMFLPYLSSDGLIFFCFSLCGVLGLLLCLKSKKHKRSDSLPSLMENCYKSYLHISATVFGWMARSLDQRVH